MNFKTYKIGGIYQNNKQVPSLRLNGKWLEKLNFSIGEQVVLYQNEDMIVITKATPEQIEMLKVMERNNQIKKLEKQIKILSKSF